MARFVNPIEYRGSKGYEKLKVANEDLFNRGWRFYGNIFLDYGSADPGEHINALLIKLEDRGLKTCSRGIAFWGDGSVNEDARPVFVRGE